MAREPWDFDLFVREYNAAAKEFGGWVWDGSREAVRLEEAYAALAFHATVRDFARAQFEYDQRT
jgi:hypothetical protein